MERTERPSTAAGRRWPGRACRPHHPHHGPRRLPVGRHPNQALVEAARAADGDETRDLVEDGADPDFRDEEGSTALMLSIVSGTEEGVRALLEGGADPDLTLDNGSTAVHMATATDRLLSCASFWSTRRIPTSRTRPA